jgi:hypothetical protein
MVSGLEATGGWEKPTEVYTLLIMKHKPPTSSNQMLMLHFEKTSSDKMIDIKKP